MNLNEISKIFWSLDLAKSNDEPREREGDGDARLRRAPTPDTTTERRFMPNCKLSVLHVIDDDTGELMLSVPCHHECIESMLRFIEELAAREGLKPPKGAKPY